MLECDSTCVCDLFVCCCCWLDQIFGEQIRQYKEGVRLLTGYKIQLEKRNGLDVLRLRSEFANHDDDELVVKWDAATGALELLDSDFCAALEPRVLGYLTTLHSFPAFLSSLTVHLFEGRTCQG